MSDSTNRSKDRTIRTDQWQPPRGSRTVRADNDARHRLQSGAAGQPRPDDAGGSAGGADSGAHADERLRELICERLTEDPQIDAVDVIIDVQAGGVTLTGSVSNERTRDVVEQCVESCGARAVHNRLSIR